MSSTSPRGFRARVRQFYRAVGVASAFATFSIFGFLLGWLVLPLAGLGKKGDARRRAIAARLCGFIRFYFNYLGSLRLLTLSYESPDAFDTADHPSVVICNHPCLLDVMAFLAAEPGVLFVAKRSMFRSPFVGGLLRLGEHIPAAAPGADPGERSLVLDAMLERLSRGRSVLVFPEGTRSPPGDLGRFAAGAFEAALRARVPLVAMRMAVEPPALTKGEPFWRFPLERVHMKLTHLARIEPDFMPDSARTFRREMRARYAAAMGLSHRESPPAATASVR